MPEVAAILYQFKDGSTYHKPYQAQEQVPPPWTPRQASQQSPLKIMTRTQPGKYPAQYQGQQASTGAALTSQQGHRVQSSNPQNQQAAQAQPQGQQPPQTQPDKERTCYNCGKTGHMRSECPDPRKRRPTSHPTFLEAAEGHLNNQQWREALGMLRGSKTLHQQGGVRWTQEEEVQWALAYNCLLYTSPSPRDLSTSRMPSSA